MLKLTVFFLYRSKFVSKAALGVVEKAQERLKAEFAKSNFELDKLRESDGERRADLETYGKRVKVLDESLSDVEKRVVAEMSARLSETASKEELRLVRAESEKQEKVENSRLKSVFALV